MCGSARHVVFGGSLRSATPTSTTCDSAHGAGGGLSGEYGNRDAGGRGWTWQIGCASTYGASRTTPCTIWSLCVICTSKPRCLLWPRFCVASRNTRGTSWGWSWWRRSLRPMPNARQTPGLRLTPETRELSGHPYHDGASDAVDEGDVA